MGSLRGGDIRTTQPDFTLAGNVRFTRRGEEGSRRGGADDRKMTKSVY